VAPAPFDLVARGRAGEPEGLGIRLRAARESLGLSTRQLAAAIGTSASFISQLENSLSAPSLATLYRLADALQSSPARLLGESAPGDVSIVRHATATILRNHAHSLAPTISVLAGGQGRIMEAYDFAICQDSDLDVWWQHESEDLLIVVDGRLVVEFAGGPTEEISAGDALSFWGTTPHRWHHIDDNPCRVILVVANEHRLDRVHP
jgi:transcriptional regulator with XRE-family HTH domain